MELDKRDNLKNLESAILSISKTLTRPQMKARVGVIPSSTTGSTGIKTISLGFKPKIIKFQTLPSLSTQMNFSIGAADELLNQYCTAITANGGTTSRNNYQTHCIVILATGTTTVAMAMKLNAMIDDGFEINVTTASSVFDIGYEAIG